MSKNILIVSLILTLSLIACSTYDEGPYFSFYSPESRITGIWEIDEVLSDDLESRALSEDYPYREITFNEDNTFVIIIDDSQETINGTWNFNEDKTEVLLITELEDFNIRFEIKRLSTNELWVIINSTNKSTSEPVIELRYIKN
jgi:hypothetical protein